jgi:putative Ca2+/H+ antiporter (TMEM165/GDT1 family)
MAAVFGIVFLAELPDKTALASLVLGTRYRSSFVFIGVAAAFALHVVIAVAAGSALSLAPHRIVEAVVAMLFLAGAVLMLRRAQQGDDHAVPTGDGPGTPRVGTAMSPSRNRPAGFWKVAGTSFGVLFVAELGDLTQITTANLAAKYHDLISVGIGATLGLWAVGGLAILGGRQLLRWIQLTWIARGAAIVMATLGVISAVAAITG